MPLMKVDPPESFMGVYQNLMKILNLEIYNAGADLAEWIELPITEAGPEFE